MILLWKPSGSHNLNKKENESLIMTNITIKKESVDKLVPYQFTDILYKNNVYPIKKENNTVNRPVRHPYFAWDIDLEDMKPRNNCAQLYSVKCLKFKEKPGANDSEKCYKQLKITEFVSARQWHDMEKAKMIQKAVNYTVPKSMTNKAKERIGMTCDDNGQNNYSKKYCLDRAVQTDSVIKEKLMDIAIQTDPVFITDQLEKKLKNLTNDEQTDDKDAIFCNLMNMPIRANCDALKNAVLMRHKEILKAVNQLSRLRSIIECISKNFAGSTVNKKDPIVDRKVVSQIEKKARLPLSGRKKLSLSGNNEKNSASKQSLNVTPITTNMATKLKNPMYTYNPYKK